MRRRLRQLGDLEVEIDRDLCVGFGDCIEVAPAAFELDEEDIAVFTRPEKETREALVAACEACPVDAITLREAGAHVAP